MEGAIRLGSIGILLGLLEQFVEFPLQHLLMALMLIKRLLKDFAAPRLFAFQLLNGGANVLDGRWLLVLFEADYGFEFRVDLKHRFAARAAHFHKLAFAFGHRTYSSVTDTTVPAREAPRNRSVRRS